MTTAQRDDLLMMALGTERLVEMMDTIVTDLCNEYFNFYTPHTDAGNAGIIDGFRRVSRYMNVLYDLIASLDAERPNPEWIEKLPVTDDTDLKED